MESVEEIANKLHLSTMTVRSYLQRRTQRYFGHSSWVTPEEEQWLQERFSQPDNYHQQQTNYRIFVHEKGFHKPVLQSAKELDQFGPLYGRFLETLLTQGHDGRNKTVTKPINRGWRRYSVDGNDHYIWWVPGGEKLAEPLREGFEKEENTTANNLIFIREKRDHNDNDKECKVGLYKDYVEYSPTSIARLKSNSSQTDEESQQKEIYFNNLWKERSSLWEQLLENRKDYQLLYLTGSRRCAELAQSMMERVGSSTQTSQVTVCPLSHLFLNHPQTLLPEQQSFWSALKKFVDDPPSKFTHITNQLNDMLSIELPDLDAILIDEAYRLRRDQPEKLLFLVLLAKQHQCPLIFCEEDSITYLPIENISYNKFKSWLDNICEEYLDTTPPPQLNLQQLKENKDIAPGPINRYIEGIHLLLDTEPNEIWTHIHELLQRISNIAEPSQADRILIRLQLVGLRLLWYKALNPNMIACSVDKYHHLAKQNPKTEQGSMHQYAVKLQGCLHKLLSLPSEPSSHVLEVLFSVAYSIYSGPESFPLHQWVGNPSSWLQLAATETLLSTQHAPLFDGFSIQHFTEDLLDPISTFYTSKQARSSSIPRTFRHILDIVLTQESLSEDHAVNTEMLLDELPHPHNDLRGQLYRAKQCFLEAGWYFLQASKDNESTPLYEQAHQCFYQGDDFLPLKHKVENTIKEQRVEESTQTIQDTMDALYSAQRPLEAQRLRSQLLLEPWPESIPFPELEESEEPIHIALLSTIHARLNKHLESR